MRREGRPPPLVIEDIEEKRKETHTTSRKHSQLYSLIWQ